MKVRCSLRILSCSEFTLASVSIPIQCVTRVATADIATNGVCTVVVTPSIVSGTLINICM